MGQAAANARSYQRFWSRPRLPEVSGLAVGGESVDGRGPVTLADLAVEDRSADVPIQLEYRRVGPSDELHPSLPHGIDDIVQQFVVFGDHGLRHTALSCRAFRSSRRVHWDSSRLSQPCPNYYGYWR